MVTLNESRMAEVDTSRGHHYPGDSWCGYDIFLQEYRTQIDERN